MLLPVAFKTHKNKQRWWKKFRWNWRPSPRPGSPPGWGIWKHQTKILVVSFFFFFPPPAHHSRPHRENSGRIRDIQSASGQTSYSAQLQPQSHQDVLNDSTPVWVGELCNKPLKWTDGEDSPERKPPTATLPKENGSTAERKKKKINRNQARI